MKLAEAPKGAKTKEGADAYDYLKDSMGRFRTQSLFVETKNEKYPAPFTLKDKEHKGALSMYRKYIEIGDPTEYTQAISLLGSWRHWEVLTSCAWFEPYISRWRAELKVKFESDRYQEMLEVSTSHKGTPQGTQATKWLADRYTTPTKSKRGRPSKEEKALHLKEASTEDQLLADEAERLGL
jgi:hypothetical protein